MVRLPAMALQRTITENAATLKFESHEFEG
jgi:hypothetical protein